MLATAAIQSVSGPGQRTGGLPQIARRPFAYRPVGRINRPDDATGPAANRDTRRATARHDVCRGPGHRGGQSSARGRRGRVCPARCANRPTRRVSRAYASRTGSGHCDTDAAIRPHRQHPFGRRILSCTWIKRNSATEHMRDARALFACSDAGSAAGPASSCLANGRSIVDANSHDSGNLTHRPEHFAMAITQLS